MAETSFKKPIRWILNYCCNWRKTRVYLELFFNSITQRDFIYDKPNFILILRLPPRRKSTHRRSHVHLGLRTQANICYGKPFVWPCSVRLSQSPLLQSGSGSDPLLGPHWEEKNGLQGCRHEYYGLTQLLRWRLPMLRPAVRYCQTTRCLFSGERSLQRYGTLACWVKLLELAFT